MLLTSDEQAQIRAAVEAGARRYFASRRARIPAFVERHFSVRGTLRLHRGALGGDLWRAPANLMWATPYLGMRLSAYLLARLGAARLSARLRRLPPGFQTRVQRQIQWLLYSELLELPFAQDTRRCDNDALLAEILAQPDIATRLIDALSTIETLSQRQDFDAGLQQRLSELGTSRIAAADLACGVVSLSAGAALFQKLTPGALSTGAALATAIAQQSAIANFAFGTTLGGFYYGLFPAAASASLVAASTGGVLAALGVVSAVSGVVTDPLQSRLGIHQRRLGRFVDRLETHFTAGGSDGLAPRELYLARLFDLFDLLKSAATLVK